MKKRGRRANRGRQIDGIVVVDKNYGASSNDVLQKVKRLYNANKAGHTGSLDPLATGVLPICFGEATKFSQYLLDSDKAYRTTMKMGVRTTTGDLEGEVVETREVNVSREQIEGVLPLFRGEIDQVPSMFSALKHNGRPLYEYAREGITIDRPARRITIYRLEIVEVNGDECVLDVECSKGTYIRSLVEDIGEAVGCLAHVSALHRTKAGPFAEGEAFSLEQIAALRNDARDNALNRDEKARFAKLRELTEDENVELTDEQLAEQKQLSTIRNRAGNAAIDALLKAPDTTISDWPEVKLPENSSYYLSQGNPVQVSGAPAKGLVRIYGIKENAECFLGIGEINDDGLVSPKRLVNTGD